MALVVDILARAARQCSVKAPSNWVTATDSSAVELKDFLDEVVTDILERIEVVPPLAKSTTITGTGVENYALPSDFVRTKREPLSVYEETTTRRACVPVSSNGTWEYLKDTGSGAGNRYYRIKGYDGNYSIDFYQPLSTSAVVIVTYVSNAWLQSGGTEFSDNADVSIIPRRILETGIVMRFRERKGLDFGAKYAEHEALLARWSNEQRQSRSVSFGDRPRRDPWDIPVPDFIPDM